MANKLFQKPQSFRLIVITYDGKYCSVFIKKLNWQCDILSKAELNNSLTLIPNPSAQSKAKP
jgi:hypothetical protein